jgi:hypothetical protein
MRQWLYFDELPERVVDADPAPSPTHAQPTPADASRRRWSVRAAARMRMSPFIGRCPRMAQAPRRFSATCALTTCARRTGRL